MTLKQAFALAVLATSVSAAFADDARQASLTREQVQAELQRARAAGELQPLGDAPLAAVVPASTRTRAELRDEVLAARTAGTLQAGGEVDLAATRPVTLASTVSRAEVKALTVAANKHHELRYGDVNVY
jgi:hypothetical protein